MKVVYLSTALMFFASSLRAAAEGNGLVASRVSPPIAVGWQPLMFPPERPKIRISTEEIEPGAVLSVHRHPYPRYDYVLSGRFRLTYTERGGKSEVYGPGEIVIEKVGAWHQEANDGSLPVKLLIVDEIDKGESNVELR